MVNLAKYSIQMVKEQGFRYHSKMITCADSVADFLSYLKYDVQTQEVFGVIALDTKGGIVGVFEISRGNINTTIVEPRDVFQRILLCGNIASFVIWHNHPSGDPTPSRQDIEVTKRIIDAGKLLGVPCLDSVIISCTGHHSIREQREVSFT